MVWKWRLTWYFYMLIYRILVTLKLWIEYVKFLRLRVLILLVLSYNVQIYIVYPCTVFHIVSHSRRINDIRNFKFGIGFNSLSRYDFSENTFSKHRGTFFSSLIFIATQTKHRSFAVRSWATQIQLLRFQLRIRGWLRSLSSPPNPAQ